LGLGGDVSYLPNSHTNLGSRTADDHTQYHTDARADARYPRKNGTGATGTWPINITGSAGSATTAGDATNTGNVDYAWDHQRGGPTYGFHLHWADQGAKTYIFQSDDNANNYVIAESTFSRASHNHDSVYGTQWGSNHVDVGTMAAGTAYGPWTWGHGLGMNPRTVIPTGTYDDNTHSIVASIGVLWDATNVVVCGRNVGAEAEACAMGFIAWG
jgi:hypothetical protein